MVNIAYGLAEFVLYKKKLIIFSVVLTLLKKDFLRPITEHLDYRYIMGPVY
ncbi:MAG: hypothetical protein ACOC44_08865 [Promethearchaeia archaeon]